MKYLTILLLCTTAHAEDIANAGKFTGVDLDAPTKSQKGENIKSISFGDGYYDYGKDTSKHQVEDPLSTKLGFACTDDSYLVSAKISFKFFSNPIKERKDIIYQHKVAKVYRDYKNPEWALYLLGYKPHPEWMVAGDGAVQPSQPPRDALDKKPFWRQENKVAWVTALGGIATTAVVAYDSLSGGNKGGTKSDSGRDATSININGDGNQVQVLGDAPVVAGGASE